MNWLFELHVCKKRIEKGNGMSMRKVRHMINHMCRVTAGVMLSATLIMGPSIQTEAVEFTTTQAPAVLETTGQVGIYAEPDSLQEPLAKVDAGIPVKVTGITSNGWFQVDVGGVYYMQGVALANLQVTSENEEKTEDTNAATQPELSTPQPIMYSSPERVLEMDVHIHNRDEIRDIIKKAAGSHVSKITATSSISAYNALWSAACGIVDQRIYSYEEATINGCSIHSYGNRKYELEFKHLSTIEEEEYVDKTVAQIAAVLNVGTTYEKILAAHDYICKHVEYSYKTQEEVPGYDCRSAYDALAEGESVCTGYALLFQKFMDMMGIPCFVADDNEHTWNIVCIDGEWYHIDCTNDDTNLGIVRNYFLLGAKDAGYDIWGGLEISDVNYQVN